MSIKIIKDPIAKSELTEISTDQFGDFVKAVVDVEQGIMAIGCELHADAEATLLEQGSHQKNLWGINLYPNMSGEEWVEFDSMINLRPSQGNRSRGVESKDVRQKIKEIVAILIVD